MSHRLALWVAAALLAAPPLAPLARAQTRPAPSVDPRATAAGPRPIPGPVYESAGFSRAVARGTRSGSRQAAMPRIGGRARGRRLGRRETGAVERAAGRASRSRHGSR